MRTATYDGTRKFLVWCVSTLIASYVAGKVGDAIFNKAK